MSEGIATELTGIDLGDERLNRRSREARILLGKLYMEEGVFPRAKDSFSHALIRENENVKNPSLPMLVSLLIISHIL